MMYWVNDAFYQEYSVHTTLITYTNNITNIILFKAKGNNYRSTYIVYQADIIYFI